MNNTQIRALTRTKPQAKYSNQYTTSEPCHHLHSSKDWGARLSQSGRPTPAQEIAGRCAYPMAELPLFLKETHFLYFKIRCGLRTTLQVREEANWPGSLPLPVGCTSF